MTSLRNKIIDEIAKTEVGYSRKENISKYTSQLGLSGSGGTSWCADFVTWCIDMLDDVPRNNDAIFTSLVSSKNSAREADAYRRFADTNKYLTFYDADSGYEPKKGDLALFDNDGGRFDHIGIVSSVDKYDKTYKYIDGNNTYGGGENVRESQQPKPYVKSNKNPIVYKRQKNTTTGLDVTIPHIHLNWSEYETTTYPAGFIAVNYEALEGSPLPPSISPDRYEKDRANNTKGTAKSLEGESGTLSNLTLHNSSDQDWFKFDWHGDGSTSNQIRLSTKSSSESFDLYSPSGSLLKSNVTTVTLARYKTRGTYYVKVHGSNGSTSKNYALTYNLKRVYRPDKYESNNSKEYATLLTTKTGVAQANIHTGTDQDWFEFTLDSTGSAKNWISLTNTKSSQRFSLHDANGNAIGLQSRTYASLDGFAKGTYYVRVYDWVKSASGNYALSWNIVSDGPSPDSDEPNNYRERATGLSSTTGTKRETIHDSSDVDYFRIQLSDTGTANNYVSAAFTHSKGDIDMQLLDKYGNLLKSATGSGDSERIDLAGKTADTYYVKVYGYRGATNNYTLSWNTTPDPVQREYEPNNSRYLADRLNGTTGTLKGSIGSSSDEDWFKFTLNGTGTQASKVEIAHGTTQRVTLYDANEKMISSSAYRSVSLANRPAGTYYVRVKDDLGFKSGDYTLRWNTASNARSASAATSRAATPSLTSAQNVMYDSTAGAFAGYLNSAGTAIQTVSQSTSDSLRKYGTLVQA